MFDCATPGGLPDDLLNPAPVRDTQHSTDPRHATSNLLVVALLCGSVIAGSTWVLSHFPNVMEALVDLFG